jgi:hypothetical protein
MLYIFSRNEMNLGVLKLLMQNHVDVNMTATDCAVTFPWHTVSIANSFIFNCSRAALHLVQQKAHYASLIFNLPQDNGADNGHNNCVLVQVCVAVLYTCG